MCTLYTYNTIYWLFIIIIIIIVVAAVMYVERIVEKRGNMKRKHRQQNKYNEIKLFSLVCLFLSQR